MRRLKVDRAQDSDPADVYVKKVEREVLLEHGPEIHAIVHRFIHSPDLPVAPRGRKLQLVKGR